MKLLLEKNSTLNRLIFRKSQPGYISVMYNSIDIDFLFDALKLNDSLKYIELNNIIINVRSLKKLIKYCNNNGNIIIKICVEIGNFDQ